MRKILYSPYFGAGWTSWNEEEVAKIMIDYKPVIEAVEAGIKLHKNHPIILEMINHITKQLGETYVCVLAADELEVTTAPDKVRINEYDGKESIELLNQYKGWL